MSGTTGGRTSDLHKSAFWIYGVTAMVMREPFANVIRHASTAGLSDWQVRLEILRTVIVLVLMARLFLLLGIYFDEVYVRPESAERFPRRSYPVDFLTGLMQLLTIVAASSTVSLHGRTRVGLPVFMVLTIAFLLFDIAWLAAAKLLRFSSAARIAGFAKFNEVTLAACVVGWGGVRIAGGDQVLADQIALLIVLAMTLFDMGRLIRNYDN
jgi:hypothetical protein